MKWITILSVWLVVLLLSSSCFLSKRSRTTTETTTITRVDTIIKVVRDTVLKTVSVPLYDTAYIQSETSETRAYYNVKTQRIDLQLKGKTFDVPVQLVKTQYIKQKDVSQNYSKSFMITGILFFLIFFFLVTVFLKR